MIFAARATYSVLFSQASDSLLRLFRDFDRCDIFFVLRTMKHILPVPIPPQDLDFSFSKCCPPPINCCFQLRTMGEVKNRLTTDGFGDRYLKPQNLPTTTKLVLPNYPQNASRAPKISVSLHNQKTSMNLRDTR